MKYNYTEYYIRIVSTLGKRILHLTLYNNHCFVAGFSWTENIDSFFFIREDTNFNDLTQSYEFKCSANLKNSFSQIKVST